MGVGKCRCQEIGGSLREKENDSLRKNTREDNKQVKYGRGRGMLWKA